MNLAGLAAAPAGAVAAGRRLRIAPLVDLHRVNQSWKPKWLEAQIAVGPKRLRGLEAKMATVS